MALMEWSDNLSVGIPEFDRQHKRLIEMINRLDNSARVYMGSQESLETLRGLELFFRFHFREEQEAMKVYDYPVIEDHRDEHEKMLTAILQVRVRLESGEESSLSNIAAYLHCWLEKHIIGFDQDYGRHITRKRASGAVKVAYA